MIYLQHREVRNISHNGRNLYEKGDIKRAARGTHRIGDLHRGVLLVLGQKRLEKLLCFHSELRCNICFLVFLFLAVREKKFKKETVDEMAIANLRKCDSICCKIVMAAIVCIGFLSAVLRYAISPQDIGYMLMGVLVLISIFRTVLFCYMDTKGI